MAANGHRHPATPSHTRPRNACSDGTSSLVRHHPATLRNCLTVKQVHTGSVLGIADRDVGGIAAAGRAAAAITGTWHREPATPARPAYPGRSFACACL